VYPFRDGNVFVRNAWYVAAFSDEVTADRVLARTILGEPVVLYRSPAGPVGLGGLCPHRQFPLALASVEDGLVVCGYHGFSFGSDGVCVSVPSQHRAAACSVPAYPVVERWRWLWIWMGDPARADPALIPDHDRVGLIEGRAFAGVHLEVACRYQLLNENLLDLSHISFLHTPRGRPRRLGFAATPDEVDVVDDGGCQRSRRRFVIDEAGGVVTPLATHHGPVELTLTIDHYPPVFHVGCQHYDRPGAGSEAERHLTELRFFHCLTPETAHSTHYFFAFARDCDLDRDEATTAMRAHFGGVLLEDKAALEILEGLVDRPGRHADVNCAADAGALRARRVLQERLDAEATGAPARPA